MSHFDDSALRNPPALLKTILLILGVLYGAYLAISENELHKKVANPPLLR